MMKFLFLAMLLTFYGANAWAGLDIGKEEKQGLQDEPKEQLACHSLHLPFGNVRASVTSYVRR